MGRSDRQISKLDHDIRRAREHYAKMDSVGQQRMLALHGGSQDKLETSQNLWAGVGLVRGGAGTALVGDPQTVAARLMEYVDAGVDSFVLSGFRIWRNRSASRNSYFRCFWARNPSRCALDADRRRIRRASKRQSDRDAQSIGVESARTLRECLCK